MKKIKGPRVSWIFNIFLNNFILSCGKTLLIKSCVPFLFCSCCFLDVVPYGILSHALQAFSMQAKHAETVINCVTRVYNYLLNQHGRVLQNAVLDLFKVLHCYLTYHSIASQTRCFLTVRCGLISLNIRFVVFIRRKIDVVILDQNFRLFYVLYTNQEIAELTRSSYSDKVSFKTCIENKLLHFVFSRIVWQDWLWRLGPSKSTLISVPCHSCCILLCKCRSWLIKYQRKS